MSRHVTTIRWDDVPHLSESAKADLWRGIPPFQRDARTKGIPQLGSGAIYPVPESEITVPPFELPTFWPRVYGLDSGWDWTAAVWGALDKETGTVYIYDVYKRGQAEIPIHAAGVVAKCGGWRRMPGVGDAAAINVQDGRQIITIYTRDHGLNIELPDKGVEAGIQDVWERLSAGKLKVFASCHAWFEEFRLYRRDEKGRIVEQNDHCQDATRYLIHSGLQRARVIPGHELRKPAEYTSGRGPYGDQGWMA